MLTLAPIRMERPGSNNMRPASSTRLGFTAAPFRPAEQTFCTTEGEYLGLDWAVRTLRHFLDGNCITIRTDHQALRWIYSTTDWSSRLMLWRVSLAGLNFDNFYKTRARHYLAEFMSRVETSSQADDEIDDAVPCRALAETARGLQMSRYVGDPMIIPVDHHELAKAQRSEAF